MEFRSGFIIKIFNLIFEPYQFYLLKGTVGVIISESSFPKGSFP